jgi:hypothetical protein
MDHANEEDDLDDNSPDSEDEPENESKIESAEYNALLASVEALAVQVTKEAKSAAMALFRQFFAEYPAAKAIGWTQDTPTFNDGDPCEFSRGELHVSVLDVDFAEVTSLDFAAEDDEDDESCSDECEPVFVEAYRVEDGPLKEGLRRLGRSVDATIFDAAFGTDDATIIVTPDGIHTHDYEVGY